jgi:transposase
LTPRLRQAERGRRAVRFVDAAHFVYGPLRGFVWCLVRRFVAAPAGRQRYSVLGALGAVTRRLIRVSTTGGVGAAAVGDRRRAVAAAGLGRPVTLVLDNARYQHTAAVKARARSLRIELLYLPSYSPNRNRIERLWRFVKKEALASRYRSTFVEFTAAIDDCLDHLNTRYRDQMASLLTLNFQTFGDEPVLAA